MLCFARMGHSLMLPSAEDIRIADEVRALFDSYDALTENKAILLEMRGDGHVTGDRLTLRRALNNLPSDAIRYTL